MPPLPLALTLLVALTAATGTGTATAKTYVAGTMYLSNTFVNGTQFDRMVSSTCSSKDDTRMARFLMFDASQCFDYVTQNVLDLKHTSVRVACEGGKVTKYSFWEGRGCTGDKVDDPDNAKTLLRCPLGFTVECVTVPDEAETFRRVTYISPCGTVPRQGYVVLESALGFCEQHNVNSSQIVTRSKGKYVVSDYNSPNCTGLVRQSYELGEGQCNKEAAPLDQDMYYYLSSQPAANLLSDTPGLEADREVWIMVGVVAVVAGGLW